MNELRDRAFALLWQANGACFLHDAREDDALWVTDLPARTAELEGVRASLNALGVTCRLDASRRLWRLDPSCERYAEALAKLPNEPPPFPNDDRLRPAYALCRLLWLHPAPLAAQPMEPIRRVIKLSQGATDPMLRAVPRLHAECAALLRERLPLPHAAGRVLSLWIQKEEQRNDHSL